MRQFRKRPVVIEAIQYLGDGDSFEAVDDFVNGTLYPSGTGHGVVIETLEGDMTADPGDWIIKGVKGEFYPCKPDVFETTYEAVESQGEGFDPSLKLFEQASESLRAAEWQLPLEVDTNVLAQTGSLRRELERLVVEVKRNQERSERGSSD